MCNNHTDLFDYETAMNDTFLNGIVKGIVSGNKKIYNPVFLYGDEEVQTDVLRSIVTEYRKTYPSRRVV